MDSGGRGNRNLLSTSSVYIYPAVKYTSLPCASRVRPGHLGLPTPNLCPNLRSDFLYAVPLASSTSFSTLYPCSCDASLGSLGLVVFLGSGMLLVVRHVSHTCCSSVLLVLLLCASHHAGRVRRAKRGVVTISHVHGSVLLIRWTHWQAGPFTASGASAPPSYIRFTHVYNFDSLAQCSERCGIRVSGNV